MLQGRHFITSSTWGEILEVDFASCQVVDKIQTSHYKFFGVYGDTEGADNPCEEKTDQICLTDNKSELKAQYQCKFGSYLDDDNCIEYRLGLSIFFRSFIQLNRSVFPLEF